MAKFSRKGWSSDFREDNFTGDQLERYKEGIRDDMAGRGRERESRGRTVHTHAMFGEVRDVSYISDEKVRLDAAENGNIQFQYLIGKHLLERGEMEGASKWLCKAARKGWPGAKEAKAELVQRLGYDPEFANCGSKRKGEKSN